MRKRLSFLSTLPLLLFLFALAPDARADGVVITSGSINYDNSSQSNSNFVLTGSGLSVGGVVQNALLFSAPPPGGTYHLGKTFVNGPLSVQPPYTVGGVTYNTWNSFENSLTLNIAAADFVLPTDTSLTDVTFSTPFSMTGFVFLGPNQTGLMTGINTGIVGGGIATASFHSAGPGGPWQLTHLNYTFNEPNPVPEPSTLLLFGTGAAGLAAKVRRRRRAKTRG